MFSNFITVLAALTAANAHIAAWHKGMYCLNGLSDKDSPNSAEVSNPLVHLSFDDFWLRGKCKNYPPADGDFLDLPVGGKATLELAANRALTTLSYDGKFTHTFPDQKEHPEYDDGTWANTCIKEPNMHTENRTRASGTVLAIAYQSDIHKVKPEDMVVVSVLEHSPWHRVAEYEIPKDLPACDDCTCAWSWVPNGCGEANMYINTFRCRVTGARPDAPKLAKALPATWCEGDKSKCRTGAKQLTRWKQQPGVDNVDLGQLKQADGWWAFPTYNEKMGFFKGAQNDIFETAQSNPDAPQPTNPPPAPETNSTATQPANPAPTDETTLNPLPTLPPMPPTGQPPLNPPPESLPNQHQHKGHRHRKHRKHPKEPKPQRRLSSEWFN